MTDDDEDDNPVYIYTAPQNERCEANSFCIIRRGETAYAEVSTRYGHRTLYCKRHWKGTNR